MAYFELYEYLKKHYTKDICDDIKASFSVKKDICVFLNTLKCDDSTLESDFESLGVDFTRLDEFCYRINSRFKDILTHSNAYNQGFFYIQNYSSYLTARLLEAKSGEKVLDMCAAPGGKSVNLANFTQNQAQLSCIEINKARFFTLKENLAKCGVIALCFNKDALSVGRVCEKKFDKILLDAPCSSYAKMGFDGFLKHKKELKNIALKQKKLLNAALNALKIGGELVYSTCTFLHEENEEVIENALNSRFKVCLLDLNEPLSKLCVDFSGEFAKQNASLSVNFSPLKAKISPAFSPRIKFAKIISQNKELSKNAKRILPDDFAMGFFIAKLKRLG